MSVKDLILAGAFGGKKGSGGGASDAENAAECQLATGTIAAGTKARSFIDTGVTLALLKQYKRFMFVFRGASNVTANNVYLSFNPVGDFNQSISRISAAGWTVAYEWVNVEENLLRMYARYEGNPSLVPPIGRNYIQPHIWNLWYAGISGPSGVCLFDFSSVEESQTIKIFLSETTTITYDWEARGLTV